MAYKKQLLALTIAATFSLVGACGDGSTPATRSDVQTVVENPKTQSSMSPGKPSAPISFEYEVIGNPIVGQPVAINVSVTSSIRDRPINVFYRVNDATSMVFPESQAKRTELIAPPGDKFKTQQITVIPQREGRLFLNVSAEIETEDGMMLKTTSIPIQVGSAPLELDSNGELIETEEGETVVSMPAEQT